MTDYSGEFFPLSDSASTDYSNILYQPTSVSFTSSDTTNAGGSDIWSSYSAFSSFTPTDNKVNSTPQTVTAGSFLSDTKSALSDVLSMGKDVVTMKTSIDSLKLQNTIANLNADVARNQAQTQATIANANLGIASDKMQVALTQAQTQLGIAQAQSQATLAAVKSNPLSSQFVTGSGILGNLSADGKISLIIGAISIYLMLKHHGA